MSEDMNERDIQDIIETVRNQVKDEQVKRGLKCSTNDEFLLRFIKASHSNPKVAFQLIQSYFKAKLEDPDSFVVQSPAKYIKMLQRTDLGIPLKGLDKCGRKIVRIRFGQLDPRLEDWTTIVQACLMGLESYSFDKLVQDNGMALIIDCENFSAKIMKWATPKKINILFTFFQDSIPIRFEVVHIVNYPIFFNVFISVLRPFVYEDFKKKLIWHRDLSSLHEHVGKKSLPIDLGGYLEDMEDTYWYTDVLEKEELFAELREMGYKK